MGKGYCHGPEDGLGKATTALDMSNGQHLKGFTELAYKEGTWPAGTQRREAGVRYAYRGTGQGHDAATGLRRQVRSRGGLKEKEEKHQWKTCQETRSQ